MNNNNANNDNNCSYNFTIPCKVRKLWKTVGKTAVKGEIECDSWGLRKFMSHFIKRLAQTHRPRDPGLHLLGVAYTIYCSCSVHECL